MSSYTGYKRPHHDIEEKGSPVVNLLKDKWSEMFPDELFGSRYIDEIVDNPKDMPTIGMGTYGQVLKGVIKGSDHLYVACKKIRMKNEREGFPITAIREIKILRGLRHKNIIRLLDVVTSRPSSAGGWDHVSVYMVFEYMEHDLSGLLESRHQPWFDMSVVKSFTRQLLEGLRYIHKNRVLHRDIKASNILISNKGELKIADFGLSRPFQKKGGEYTNNVITLWYRPPELLLGTKSYGPHVDIWSAGCVLAELLNRKPLFSGTNEIEQLQSIFRIMGTPSQQEWPAWQKSELYEKVYKDKLTLITKSNLKEVSRKWHPNVSSHGYELLSNLLIVNPERRIDAEKAFNHEYFYENPKPCPIGHFPIIDSAHEYEIRQRKKQKTVSSSNK